MKHSKKLTITLVAACMLLNLYLMVCNMMLRIKSSNVGVNPNGTQMTTLEAAHSIYTINDLYANCGIQLDGGIMMTNVTTHEPVELRSLLNSIRMDEVVIACRFTQHDCEKCVTYALERAAEYLRGCKGRLVVLGQYNDDHSLKAMSNRIGMQCQSVWYNIQALDIPIEQHGNPYYFVMTNDGTVLDTFTPDNMDPQLTDRYFALIETKWHSTGHQWY